MEWTINVTLSSDELFEMIERINAEPLTDNQKSHIVSFMNGAFSGLEDAAHPTRVAMLAQTAAVLALEIKREYNPMPPPGILQQFPGLVRDDDDSGEV